LRSQGEQAVQPQRLGTAGEVAVWRLVHLVPDVGLRDYKIAVNGMVWKPSGKLSIFVS
jgi:hypothetical protein